MPTDLSLMWFKYYVNWWNVSIKELLFLWKQRWMLQKHSIKVNSNCQNSCTWSNFNRIGGGRSQKSKNSKKSLLSWKQTRNWKFGNLEWNNMDVAILERKGRFQRTIYKQNPWATYKYWGMNEYMFQVFTKWTGYMYIVNTAPWWFRSFQLLWGSL